MMMTTEICAGCGGKGSGTPDGKEMACMAQAAIDRINGRLAK